MGGHKDGQVASACVVESFLEGYKKEEEHKKEWLEEQIRIANEKVLYLQEQQYSNMKTTVVALAIDKQSASWVHVGDSRLYYLSEGTLKEFTDDHSVAYKKYQLGQITRAEINTDEDQSSLLRTIGGNRAKPDICVLEDKGEMLHDGDAFLLCSDGVWEYLFDEEIVTDYKKAGNAEEWATLLLDRIMERIPEDNDNLTLITVFIKE